jgi:hypothetical protein
MTRETVMIETPASAATSAIVGALFWRDFELRRLRSLSDMERSLAVLPILQSLNKDRHCRQGFMVAQSFPVA